jgi:translocation and assembly module TamB
MPEDLSEAVLPSNDVIIMNGKEKIEPERERFRLSTRLKLIMGEKVHFKGFGVEGRLKGTLSIEDEPGRPMEGTGEINLTDGLYKAYGTKLSIEHGKLIFTGGPVDNPGIDARVTKKTGNVLSGLKLSGQLKNPYMTLFSDPPMPQPEVFSYLMFGKPLQKLSKDHGKELYGFASSFLLNTKNGNMLEKDIASRLGLQEIKITSDKGVEGSSIFINKYLAPSLYITYGVGLFSQENSIKLLYHINKNWRLETESGSSFSGSDLIYSTEK